MPKLSQIPGLLLEKNDLSRANVELECDSVELNQMIGWNSAIDLQGEVEIELNKEVLAKELFEICEYPNPDSWENEDTDREIWRVRANIIADNLHKILVVKK